VKTVQQIVNRPEWTKAVFLRHPFERLVSCYKDKFGRDNRLYSVKMSGNRSTHILSFEEFVRLIAAPGSEHQNAHWRPQSRFCGFQKYQSKFNFIGNFENLTAHVEVKKEEDLFLNKWHEVERRSMPFFNLEWRHQFSHLIFVASPPPLSSLS
jgi:hypothetical protein